MAPVGSERKVPTVVQDLREATRGQISKRLGTLTEWSNSLRRSGKQWGKRLQRKRD